VPCWIHLREDEEAIMCNEAADVVLQRMEAASPDWY
jgi:hypothetical protein